MIAFYLVLLAIIILISFTLLPKRGRDILILPIRWVLFIIFALLYVVCDILMFPIRYIRSIIKGTEECKNGKTRINKRKI